MSSASLDLRPAETRGTDYVERARELAPLLADAADEIEAQRELPERVVEALIAGGFFRLLLPRSLGGAELHPLTYVQVLEELGKAEPSVAWCLGQNSGCSMSAPYLEPAVAREIFGPPRGILAWGPDLPGAGRGVAVEGGIRVIGLRGTGSDSYALNDLFVPQKYTCSRDNEAERREPGLLYRFTSGMIYAMGFSNVSLGIARGALEAFVELARDKIPRGARKTLRENNVIQSEVAQSEAKLRSARAFIHTTLREMWEEAEEKGDFGLDKHWQLRLASTWAIHQARDVVATIYHAAGATAIFNENPFERRLRDIHAGTQQGQGRPIHFETVGQIRLGLPPEGRMFR